MNRKLIVAFFSLFLFSLLLSDVASASILYSDGRFTLNLPSDWAGKYKVRESVNPDSSRDIIFFHPLVKKEWCQGGYLFFIMIKNHRDEEDPFVKFIGSRGGKYYYFAVPRDVQCEGVPEFLYNEFTKMQNDLDGIRKSIKLTKSAPQKAINYSDPDGRFTLQLPKSWTGKYVVKEVQSDNSVNVAFIHIVANKQHTNSDWGTLFSIMISDKREDNGFAWIKLIGKKGGRYYHFVTPADLQCESDTRAFDEFEKMNNDREAIYKSIKL